MLGDSVFCDAKNEHGGHMPHTLMKNLLNASKIQKPPIDYTSCPRPTKSYPPINFISKKLVQKGNKTLNRTNQNNH